MAQSEYKGRHDRIASAVHWGLAKKYGLPHAEKWYDHKAEAASENEDVKQLVATLKFTSILIFFNSLSG